jgi:hypothetical protein
MTNLEIALKAAGVPVPVLNKRVWGWLKDHPGKTSNEVAVALGITVSRASGALNYMENRKMVVANPRQSRTSGRKLKEYSALGREYQLLPLVKPAPPPPPVVRVEPPPRTPISLEGLSLIEAKALYEQLKEFFK